MRFVKGNKKIPYYANDKTKPSRQKDTAVESASLSNEKDMPLNNKPITPTADIGKPANPFSEKLKALDELAPLPEAKIKKGRSLYKNNRSGTSKSRVAVICAVVGLSLCVFAGSIFSLMYFGMDNPLNLFQQEPTVMTSASAEEGGNFPSGTPVIEYKLLSSKIDSESKGLNLSLASAGDLIEIRVTDLSGQLVEGVDFLITLIDPLGNSTEHTVDEDGAIELTDLDEEGRYTAILHPVEGYPVVAPGFVDVNFTIDTNPLDEEALKDKIKDESEIEVSKEDSQYNGASPPVDSTGTAPPPATVVTPVPTEKDGTTEVVVTDTYYLPKNNELHFTVTDGEHAGEYTFILNESGEIVGAVKNVSSTAEASMNLLTDFLFEMFTANIEETPTDSSLDTSSPESQQGSSIPTDSSSVSISSSSSVSSSSVAESSSSSSSSETNSGSSSTPEPPVATTEPVPQDLLFSSSGENLIMREPFASFADKFESVSETIYYGWHTLNGDEYYFDTNGDTVTGYVSINGVFYTFGIDGKLQKGITDGIDVSKWQGAINWTAVKASGIDYAIIRLGYRGYSTGVLVEDPYFQQNLDGAIAAGLDVGVYFFTQAITVQEAIEEASFCLQRTAGYNLKYGITFDTEYEANGGRANVMSVSLRTQITNAFCDTVKNGGKVPMVYASKSWFIYQLDYTAIDHNRIWLAHYTAQTDFSYRYDLWQYTSTGSVPGVNGGVDMNYSYITP